MSQRKVASIILIVIGGLPIVDELPWHRGQLEQQTACLLREGTWQDPL